MLYPCKYHILKERFVQGRRNPISQYKGFPPTGTV
jgi:hypothetical protein